MNTKNDLPFDQYSRQITVSDMMDQLRTSRKQSFKILDVGGYKGKTKDFCKEDSVTVLDVFDVHEKNYIRGDGTNLKCANDEYDFVVSFDVLEHIPRQKRADFILECARVAKEGFFLCCPYENGSGLATDAEKALNDLYTKLGGSEHPWLKEHIENGLPTISDIEGAIANSKLSSTKLYSNKITDWVTMQIAFFLSSALNIVSHEAGKQNHYYNKNLPDFEAGANKDSAYRVIFFISEDRSNIKKVDQYINNRNHKSSKSMIAKLPLLVSEIVERKVEDDNTVIKNLQNNLVSNQESIDKLQEVLMNTRKSLSWRITKPLRTLNQILKRKGVNHGK